MMVIVGIFLVQVMDAKPLLKEALQAEVGLPVDRNVPLIGFIGRLEEQKGSDIFVAAISQLVEHNVQIVILVSIRIKDVLGCVVRHAVSEDMTCSFRELAKRNLRSRLSIWRFCTLTRQEELQNSMCRWRT